MSRGAAEIWMVDLGMAAKVRPCLVISIGATEQDRALATVVPHTTSTRNSRFEVKLKVSFLREGAFDISAAADLGVMARTPADFEWTLCPESWLQVDEQLEPFCEEKSGVSFQYLNPGSGPEIIYSTARAW